MEELTAFQSVAILISVIGNMILVFVLYSVFSWFVCGAFLGPGCGGFSKRFWIPVISTGLVLSGVGLVLCKLLLGW